MTGLPLSEMLLRSGLLTLTQVEEAVRTHRQSGVRLGQVVVDLGYAAEGTLYDALARVSGLARLDLTREPIDRAAIRYVDSIWALDHGMVPMSADPGQRTIRVAVTDPTHLEPLDELSFRTGLRVHSVLGSEAEIGRLIRHQFFEEPLEAPTAGVPTSNPSAPSAPDPVIEHGMESALEALSPRSASAPDDETQAIAWLRAMVDSHQENVRLLQALFELCVARGIITRDEYLARLNEEDRRGGT